MVESAGLVAAVVKCGDESTGPVKFAAEITRVERSRGVVTG